MDIGLLLIRAVLGLSLAAHGAQKLFGAFGGHGIEGTGGYFESIGFKPGKPLATLAGLGEFFGGLGFAFGFLTPFSAAVIIATMMVAVWGVHLDKGFFSQNGGYEFPLILGVVAAGVAFTGPGRVSIDAALGLPLWGVWWGLLAIGLGLVGSLPALASRALAGRRTTAS